MKKLAIITTHPIQYNAPVFNMLNERGEIYPKVFYTWEKAQNGFYDQKFKQEIKWDIPLLEGYEYQFVKNISSDQGTHHRKGIVNPTLIREIETFEPDAILVYGWNFKSHYKAMRYFKGKIPVLFRGDSTLLNEKPGIKTFLRRLTLKFVYRAIDYAFYVGTNNKHYYLKHGIREKKLIFAPHAIDNERFYDKTHEMQTRTIQWKKELGIDKEDIVILFAGKFEKIKNPVILIYAAKELQNRRFKFIFAGDGELKNEMLIASQKLNNILFLPFQNQSQMPVLYRLADVFALSSNSETWGLGINEAMACGKAILASNKVGGAIDLIKNGKNGYIFEAGNLSDLIQKLNNFEKQKCELFGANSKKMVEVFNFDRFCNALENLLLKNK